MKLPRKNIPFALAVLGAAFFASATALAKPPEGGVSASLAGLPQYMVHTANLSNKDYMACIAGKVKRPAEVNVLNNFGAAIDCQRDLKL